MKAGERIEGGYTRGKDSKVLLQRGERGLLLEGKGESKNRGWMSVAKR